MAVYSSSLSDAKLFEGTDHADEYLKYRPTWPPEIIQKSLSFLHKKMSKPFHLAVDVGCGSGQNTQPLSPYFKRVIGVDVSEAQIAAAKRTDSLPNVEYVLGSAENIPVADSSVDLVTCAESIHWFDLDSFFKEVDRILKPSGCVAIYSCSGIWPWVDGDDEKSKQLKKIMHELSRITLGPYTSPRIKLIHDKLVDVHMPYEETIRDDTMFIHLDTSMSSYIGYIKSWSYYQEFKKKNPHASDPLVEVQERLTAILGLKAPADDAEVHARALVVLLLGRKPSQSAEIKS